jgi:hypothetical protein
LSHGDARLFHRCGPNPILKRTQSLSSELVVGLRRTGFRARRIRPKSRFVTHQCRDLDVELLLSLDTTNAVEPGLTLVPCEPHVLLTKSYVAGASSAQLSHKSGGIGGRHVQLRQRSLAQDGAFWSGHVPSVASVWLSVWYPSAEPRPAKLTV